MILDCNDNDAWRRGHIPGAVVMPGNWAENPDINRQHVMTPQQFKAMAAGVGVGDDITVVT